MNRLLAYTMACLLMLVTGLDAFAQYVNPCAEDIAKFCSHARGWYIAECLSQNEEQLSPKCKSIHLNGLADVLRQAQQVCATDSARFCGAESVQPSIKLLTCLRMQSGLEPECRTKLFEALEMMHY